jgi:hypothetical protein
MTAVPVRSYSRRSATLTYSLSQPSRVHVQAGTSTIDPATKQAAGAVMKTVVNREPRIAGTIAEHWSGFDESGLVFVPDLPDFVVAIAASPLPENSIITFGNRKRQFLETLANRHGTSLFTKRARGEHHTGLQTADDVSPGLVIAPLNAAWSAADRAWIAEPGVPLRLKLSVEGPTAATFQTHPATVEVFVDGKRIGGQQEKRTDIVEVPSLANGAVRRVSINWNSDWGPVAANTIQVLARDQASAPGAVK